MEVGTIGHDQQHAERSYSVHEVAEQFEARGVSPLRILEDHQYRVLP